MKSTIKIVTEENIKLCSCLKKQNEGNEADLRIFKFAYNNPYTNLYAANSV